MNYDAFRRYKIDINIDKNAEKEYSFVKNGEVFNSGDVCIGNPALYHIDSGRLNCDCENELTFLYKIGEYYFVKRNHPMFEGEFVFIEPQKYIIKLKEKPK